MKMVWYEKSHTLSHLFSASPHISSQVRAQDARARRHHTRRLLPLGGHRLPRLRPDPTLTLTPKTDLGRVADDPAV